MLPCDPKDLNSIIPNATVSAAEAISDRSSPGEHKKIVASALVSVPGGGQQWRRGLNDAGQIVVDGQKSGSNVGACLLTLSSAPAAAVTSAAASPTDEKTSRLAPVNAPGNSSLPLTVTRPSSHRPPESTI